MILSLIEVFWKSQTFLKNYNRLMPLYKWLVTDIPISRRPRQKLLIIEGNFSLVVSKSHNLDKGTSYCAVSLSNLIIICIAWHKKLLETRLSKVIDANVLVHLIFVHCCSPIGSWKWLWNEPNKSKIVLYPKVWLQICFPYSKFD